MLLALFGECVEKSVSSLIYIIHMIQEYHESVGFSIYKSSASTSANMAYQTSDTLQYPMNNKFIMYCLCVNAIVTSLV